MKRIWVTILLLVYFTVSSGFVISLHYCMGEPAGVEIGAAASDDCGKCGMPVKAKKGCCQDELKIVKLQQDQSAATFAVFHFGIDGALPVQPFKLFSLAQQSTWHLTPPAHAPPLISRQDTYLINCVFRI